MTHPATQRLATEDFVSRMFANIDLSGIGGLVDVGVEDLPAGSVTSVVQNAGGTWPNRPTARTDIRVIWIRIVAGSANPSAATTPSLTGAYSNDLVVGA